MYKPKTGDEFLQHSTHLGILDVWTSPLKYLLFHVLLMLVPVWLGCPFSRKRNDRVQGLGFRDLGLGVVFSFNPFFARTF